MLWRPRLRTILLIINLGILLLPLGGIGVLQLYEGELVRRTESELISQGTLVGAVYREELLRLRASDDDADQAGIPAPQYGLPATFQPVTHVDPTRKYHPIIPTLDIANGKVRPPAPSAAVPAKAADPVAAQAGQLLAPILRSSKDTTLVGIRVLDSSGTVVATTGDELGLSLANREEARRALTGEYVSLLRLRISDESQPDIASLSRGNLKRLFVGMPVMHEGRVLGAVVLSRTPLDIRKALYLVRGQLAVAAAVLLGVVLVVTILTSVTVNRPLKALVRQAERIMHGEKVLPVENKSGIHEIEQLSQAMSAMAKTLEERGDYIRTFAANVSHEFKTPLTSIRGTVELLDDHFKEMSAEERDRFLRIIATDTERLDRLVRRLLDLARADTFTVGEERTDALETLAHLAQRYLEKGVSVVVACSDTSVHLKMGREAFESVVSNMIENARQHGGDVVQVRITGRVAELPGEGQAFDLDIQDDGRGISEGNRDKVFRPFFTTARETGGSGMGLSIVQALLRAHGGSITLEPSEHGALFRLRVPV
ncbi:MAG: hypothetical protein A2075_08160 [Geobacteraceae bacterium GWC2_58_44]|nr:MAG: hypothetical protein A2075_08160 [Geobacteraceae bacterium GWC2_58_44]HBG07149.1 histidine kinase [Geobacter sp.]